MVHPNAFSRTKTSPLYFAVLVMAACASTEACLRRGTEWGRQIDAHPPLERQTPIDSTLFRMTQPRAHFCVLQSNSRKSLASVSATPLVPLERSLPYTTTSSPPISVTVVATRRLLASLELWAHRLHFPPVRRASRMAEIITLLTRGSSRPWSTAGTSLSSPR
jgi:hypothetical protein